MHSFILSLLLVGTGSSFLIEQDSTIFLKPSFKEGQVKDYIITYTVKTNVDDSNQSLSTTKNVTFKVITTNSDLTTDMECSFNEVQFTESSPKNNAFAVLMNTLVAGITVKYTIHEDGSIKSISNYEGISSQIRNNIDKQLDAMDLNEPSKESARFQLKMAFSSNSQIDNILLNDLYQFHRLYGYRYSKDIPISLKTDPNFPSDKLEVTLKSLNERTCLFESSINSIEKKEDKSFKFSLPECWPQKLISSSTFYSPLEINQLYQIESVE